MDFLNDSFHTITLVNPMRVTVDGGMQFYASILIGSSIRGEGPTVMITLIEAENNMTKKVYAGKIGVAVPLSNIAGWQTEVRKR